MAAFVTLKFLSTVRRPNIATAVDQLPATAMYTDARERRASLRDRERQPGDGQSATQTAGADVRTHRVRYGSVAAAAPSSRNLGPAHVAGSAPTAPSRRKNVHTPRSAPTPHTTTRTHT